MHTQIEHSQSEEKPTRKIEHDYLKAFTGEWKTEGRYGLEPHMSGFETYQFLEAGYFLINHWSRSFGHRKHLGTGFIGYDTMLRKFVSHSCDNLGYARTYDVELEPRLIKMTGPKERAEIRVSEDGMELSIHWEINQNGKWSALCDLKGSRLH